jgi:hypothetical protein
MDPTHQFGPNHFRYHHVNGFDINESKQVRGLMGMVFRIPIVKLSENGEKMLPLALKILVSLKMKLILV